MSEPREDDLFQKSTMTFGEHLGELRGCLVKSLLGLVVGFAIGLMVGSHVVSFIQQPLLRALATYYQRETTERLQGQLPPDEVKKRVEQEHLLADEVYIDPAQMFQELKKNYPEQFKNVPPLPRAESTAGNSSEKMIHVFLWHRSADDPRLQSKSFSPLESFSVYIKASLLVGILLASPWIFFQIWHFVAAGLYPHERHYVQAYLPFSLGLFLFGAALAFFVVFGPVLEFLLSFNRSMNISVESRINDWLSFVWLLPVGFGVGFQLPLVMLFLERIGVFTVQNYIAQWRIAVLVIFVIAGILMPPDPYSMLLNAGALSLLYFGGILLCKFLPRKSSPFGEGRGR